MSALFGSTGASQPEVVVCDHCGRRSRREPGASCEGCGSSRTEAVPREPPKAVRGTNSRGAR